MRLVNNSMSKSDELRLWRCFVDETVKLDKQHREDFEKQLAVNDKRLGDVSPVETTQRGLKYLHYRYQLCESFRWLIIIRGGYVGIMAAGSAQTNKVHG